MTDAEAQDWMIERRRRARDTIVEHTREVREIKDIPPELLEKMSAIEAAYAAWKADRSRLDNHETRIDSLEQRIAASEDRDNQLARVVAELANALGVGNPPQATGTAIAIRVEQLEEHATATADLTAAVAAMHAAMQGMASQLTAKYQDVSSRVQKVEALASGFEDAFGQMREAARRLG